MQKSEQFILPFVLLSMLAIKAGNAIECYNCDSSSNKECLDVSKSASLKPQTCTTEMVKIAKTSKSSENHWLHEVSKLDIFDTGESIPMVCQIIHAKDDKGEEVLFRGCQVHGGKSDICVTTKKLAEIKHVEILDCKTCEEDGCNKSPSHMANVWLLLVPLTLIKAFV